MLACFLLRLLWLCREAIHQHQRRYFGFPGRTRAKDLVLGRWNILSNNNLRIRQLIARLQPSRCRYSNDDPATGS
jgi:hypothetical protein